MANNKSAPDYNHTAGYRHTRFHQVPLTIREAALKEIFAGRKRQVDVADELNIRRQTVNAWVRRIREGRKPMKRGRPATANLSDSETQHIQTIVTGSTPRECGINSSASDWNEQHLIALIKKETDRTLYKSYATRLLQEFSGELTCRSNLSAFPPPPFPPARKSATTHILSPKEMLHFRELIDAARQKCNV